METYLWALGICRVFPKNEEIHHCSCVVGKPWEKNHHVDKGLSQRYTILVARPSRELTCPTENHFPHALDGDYVSSKRVV